MAAESGGAKQTASDPTPADEVDEIPRYSMMLEWEPEGGVFVVTVPELPGCRTHGKTYEEAVKHGQEVIELWIDAARDEGDPIPPARYFDLDSIDVTGQNSLMLTGDDEDDALPYQERTVSLMVAKVEQARRASEESSPSPADAQSSFPPNGVRRCSST